MEHNQNSLFSKFKLVKAELFLENVKLMNKGSKRGEVPPFVKDHSLVQKVVFPIPHRIWYIQMWRIQSMRTSLGIFWYICLPKYAKNKAYSLKTRHVSCFGKRPSPWQLCPFSKPTYFSNFTSHCHYLRTNHTIIKTKVILDVLIKKSTYFSFQVN